MSLMTSGLIYSAVIYAAGEQRGLDSWIAVSAPTVENVSAAPLGAMALW